MHPGALGGLRHGTPDGLGLERALLVVGAHGAECTDASRPGIVAPASGRARRGRLWRARQHPFRVPPDKSTALFGTIGVVQPPETRDWVAIFSEPLPVDAATAWATTPASGAVVTFLGVVRDHSEGRDGVRGLTYEAYEEEALRRLTAVATETRARWPAVERLAVLHRLGDLALSEASVAVVASSPHRAEAFAAARFCIDTLKETVPIWKREHWEGGSDWATCSHQVRGVTTAGESHQSAVHSAPHESAAHGARA